MSDEFTPGGVDIDALTRPFPPHALKQREGARGMMLTYVETETVIRRLNAATNNCWDFKVTKTEWLPWGQSRAGDPLQLLVVYGELSIPGLGTRAGTGVQIVNPSGGEDMLKGGMSDCLKKAAVSFGIGIDLYGPDLEAGEIAMPAQPAYRRGDVAAEAPAPQPARDGKATPDQIKALFSIGKRKYGMDPAAVKAHIADGWGCTIDDLPYSEATKVIATWQASEAIGVN